MCLHNRQTAPCCVSGFSIECPAEILAFLERLNNSSGYCIAWPTRCDQCRFGLACKQVVAAIEGLPGVESLDGYKYIRERHTFPGHMAQIGRAAGKMNKNSPVSKKASLPSTSDHAGYTLNHAYLIVFRMQTCLFWYHDSNSLSKIWSLLMQQNAWLNDSDSLYQTLTLKFKGLEQTSCECLRPLSPPEVLSKEWRGPTIRNSSNLASLNWNLLDMRLGKPLSECRQTMRPNQHRKRSQNSRASRHSCPKTKEPCQRGNARRETSMTHPSKTFRLQMFCRYYVLNLYDALALSIFERAITHPAINRLALPPFCCNNIRPHKTSCTDSIRWFLWRRLHAKSFSADSLPSFCLVINTKEYLIPLCIAMSREFIMKTYAKFMLTAFDKGCFAEKTKPVRPRLLLVVLKDHQNDKRQPVYKQLWKSSSKMWALKIAIFCSQNIYIQHSHLFSSNGCIN